MTVGVFRANASLSEFSSRPPKSATRRAGGAAAHALNGEDADARFWIARARQQNPEISIEHFRKATPMADAELQDHMIRLLTQNWS